MPSNTMPMAFPLQAHHDIPCKRKRALKIQQQEQVEKMQYYTILVGVNGAGFMNALYLPPNGVAIQLAPYNTTLNIGTYAELMKARGPYLEWHNTHKENHFVPESHPNAHGVDTIVDTKEFRELIQEALAVLAKDEL